MSHTRSYIRLQPETHATVTRIARAEHGPLASRVVELDVIADIGVVRWADYSTTPSTTGSWISAHSSGFAQIPSDPDAWVLAKVRAEAHFAARRMRDEAADLMRRAAAIEAALANDGAKETMR